MRRAPVRRIAAGQLWRAQPHPPRRTRKARAAGVRATLPRAYSAQRCRLGVPGRPPHQTRALDGLLADDLACSRAGDAADFGRHARSAGTPAPAHRRAALPAARPGIGATREADDHPSRSYAHRTHRPARPRAGHAGQIRSFTSRRTSRSAQRPSCDGPGRCRGTHGKFASRRRCGSPATRTFSCCRAIYARGKARTKFVIANGTSLFLETSFEYVILIAPARCGCHQAAFFASAGWTARKPILIRFQALTSPISRVSFTCSSSVKCRRSTS